MKEEARYDKDSKDFQTLNFLLSVSSAGPGPQKEAVAMGPIIPKAKPMPVKRGDASPGASIPTQPVQPAHVTGRPVRCSRYRHWTAAATNTTAQRRGGVI